MEFDAKIKGQRKIIKKFEKIINQTKEQILSERGQQNDQIDNPLF